MLNLGNMLGVFLFYKLDGLNRARTHAFSTTYAFFAINFGMRLEEFHQPTAKDIGQIV